MQGIMNIVDINMYINLTSQACYSDIGQGGIRIKNVPFLLQILLLVTFSKGFWAKLLCWKIMSKANNYDSHLPGVNLVVVHKLSKIKLNNLNPIKRQKNARSRENQFQMS